MVSSGESGHRDRRPRLTLAAAAGALLAVPLTGGGNCRPVKESTLPPPGRRMPITTEKLAGDRGPVLVTTEYRIDVKDPDRFLAGAVSPVRGPPPPPGVRRPPVAGRFVEIFLTDSWLEHLRHHARISEQIGLARKGCACTAPAENGPTSSRFTAPGDDRSRHMTGPSFHGAHL